MFPWKDVEGTGLQFHLKHVFMIK